MTQLCHILSHQDWLRREATLSICKYLDTNYSSDIMEYISRRNTHQNVRRYNNILANSLDHRNAKVVKIFRDDKQSEQPALFVTSGHKMIDQHQHLHPKQQQKNNNSNSSYCCCCCCCCSSFQTVRKRTKTISWVTTSNNHYYIFTDWKSSPSYLKSINHVWHLCRIMIRAKYRYLAWNFNISFLLSEYKYNNYLFQFYNNHFVENA